tara:strand:- start:1956 stop:2192 length:237 start_codon:yes stop_codon:yes gene_type:complete
MKDSHLCVSSKARFNKVNSRLLRLSFKSGSYFVNTTIVVMLFLVFMERLLQIFEADSSFSHKKAPLSQGHHSFFINLA